MMEQIDRDVMRTHPGLHFFSGDDGMAVTHREVRAPALTCRHAEAWTDQHECAQAGVSSKARKRIISRHSAQHCQALLCPHIPDCSQCAVVRARADALRVLIRR